MRLILQDRSRVPLLSLYPTLPSLANLDSSRQTLILGDITNCAGCTLEERPRIPDELRETVTTLWVTSMMARRWTDHYVRDPALMNETMPVYSVAIPLQDVGEAVVPHTATEERSIVGAPTVGTMDEVPRATAVSSDTKALGGVVGEAVKEGADVVTRSVVDDGTTLGGHEELPEHYQSGELP